MQESTLTQIQEWTNMIIKKFNIILQKEVQMDIPITEAEMERIQQGELIQRVVPHLSSDQREFIISGMLPGQWEEMFPDE